MSAIRAIAKSCIINHLFSTLLGSTMALFENKNNLALAFTVAEQVQDMPAFISKFLLVEIIV